MADAVILPQLNRLGISVIDRLIISHKDKDHAGNRDRLLAALTVRSELSSYPFDSNTQRCQRGQHWHWQGLEFAVLWPERVGGSRNNDGCVVQIRDGKTRVLLSADIEHQAERQLVALEGAGLASTLLVSPHHGSRTSSTFGFVQAVAPRYVVHSAGFMNRWHFPRPEVVTRYQAARQWITGHHGAILIEPSDDGLSIRAQRDHGPWYRRSGAWWKPKLWLE
jgi:competence protein ComEC